MRLIRSSPIVFLLIGMLLFGRPAAAHASIPTKGEVVLIFVGVGAVGAILGVTVYHFAHRAPSVTGCVSGTAGAWTLQSESDHRTYGLTGDTGELQAGERARITGRKLGKGHATLAVEKVRRDYGACPVAAP